MYWIMYWIDARIQIMQVIVMVLATAVTPLLAYGQAEQVRGYLGNEVVVYPIGLTSRLMARD
jgi:hypothetical protein